MSTTAGIDIGSESIKGVVLGKTQAGVVEMLAAGTMPIGELGHMDESPDKVLAIGLKLKELVRTARLKGTARRLGVSGKSTSIRYLQVPPVPPWRLEMLVNYEVNEKGSDKDPQTFDYHILDVPEVGGQYTVLIGMVKEGVASDLLSAGKASGLGEVEIDLEAIALYNAYYHGHGFDSDKTVMIVDVGADDTTILICHHGALFFARTIMGGGRRFTQVLAEELKIDAVEAEALKRTTAEISFDLTPITGRTNRIPRIPGATGIGTRGGTTMMSRNAGAAAAKGDAGPTLPAGQPAAKPAEVPADDLDLIPSLDALDVKNNEATTLISGSVLELSPSGSAPAPTPTMRMGMDTPEEKRRRQMTGALVREAATLCAALENAMTFCKQQTKLRDLKLDRIYLTGGASKLKGLPEFMGRRMRVEVMALEPFKQVSLARLPEEHQAALKAEQHTMAVATGLSLADLQRGAFSLLLWPDALTQKKKFWSRGAYLYYAAALVLLSMTLFLFAPYRNQQALEENFAKAEAAVNDANTKSQELKKLAESDEEKRRQLQQIGDNTLSGHFFLNLLAELKSTARINDDLWLTQVSTNMPQVIRNLGEGGEKGPMPVGAGLKKAAALNDADLDTFQTQRRVYLRGFVRGEKDGATRIEKIRDFMNRVLPFPDDPDNPANLFKDVRPIWFSTDDYKQGARKLYVPDQSIQRAKGAISTQIWVVDKDTMTASRRTVTVGQPKDGWVEVIGPSMDRVELMITGDTGGVTEGLKLHVEGEDIKVEGKNAKIKGLKFKAIENFWYLTEFVLEAYTEGTRETTPAKKPAPAARNINAKSSGNTAAAPAGPAVPAAPTLPQANPAVPAGPAIRGVQQPAAQQPGVTQPAAQQPTVQQPAVQQPAVQQPAVQQPAVPEVPKKKKFIAPAQPNAAPEAAPAK